MLANHTDDVCFTSSWEDMNVAIDPTDLRDPTDLCGPKYMISFKWLNQLLQDLFGVFSEKLMMLDCGLLKQGY